MSLEKQVRTKQYYFSSIRREKEEINLDLNKIKEGVNENALQALLKNLSNAVIKANVAPIDYKVTEL